MECTGPKDDEVARLRFKTTDAQPSKSGIELPHSKPLHPQSKSGATRSESENPPHSERCIAGHIDLLQWTFNTLHILDFKPNAKKENNQKVTSQLSLYALALMCRTGVSLKQTRCAWFDGEDRYSFRTEKLWSAQA